jgi:tRNA pseudouridine13 synthase
MLIRKCLIRPPPCAPSTTRRALSLPATAYPSRASVARYIAAPVSKCLPSAPTLTHSSHSLTRTHSRSFHMSIQQHNRSEEYSGILAFANAEAGFQGILKQRFTDFIVREIDPSGAAAQLTSLSGKELESRLFPAADKPDIAPDALADFMASLRAVVPLDEDKAEELTDFIEKAASQSDSCPEYAIVCGSTDKPTRSSVHGLFKLKFKGVVESDTTPVAGVSSIRLQPCFKLKKGWNNRASVAWPADVPNHLRFVLAKENCDTGSAVGCLSKYFRCADNSIKYAGTKVR